MRRRIVQTVEIPRRGQQAALATVDNRPPWWEGVELRLQNSRGEVRAMLTRTEACQLARLLAEAAGLPEGDL